MSILPAISAPSGTTWERGETNIRTDVSLLCHRFRSDQLNRADFCIVSEYFPCGLVVGKSLMCMAIIVETFFRPSNGRSAIS